MPRKGEFECEACCKRFDQIDYHLVDKHGVIVAHTDEIEEQLRGQEWGGLCPAHATGNTYYDEGECWIVKGRTYAPGIV